MIKEVIGGAAAIIIYGLMHGMIANMGYKLKYHIPTEAILTKDLDGNKIPDFIITKYYGHKTPMFGYEDQKTQETIYVTGTRMEELFPESVIDYKGIEARLNAK